MGRPPLNLVATYVCSVVLAAWLAKLTHLKRPASVFGLVTGVAIAMTFLVSIGISRAYWGYFISRPARLNEVSEIVKIKAVVPFGTE